MIARRTAFFLMSLIFITVLQSGKCFARKFDDEGFKFFNWKNPTPRFTDLGFDIDNICKIIGKGQLLISHKGKEFDLWTNDNGDGVIKKYKNARFVSSLCIINKSRKTVIDYYMNFAEYPNFMKQFTVGEILKSEKNQHLVRLKQVYKAVVLTLSADFRYLYSMEKNGDFSVLLLEGDVGAGVARLEFIPVSENKTLVVSTTWLDLDSARFVYRTLLKAQPDVKPTAPLGAAAMLTEQYRRRIDQHDINPPCDNAKLPEHPEIPFYNSGNIPIQTLRQLSDMGTLVFVHPMQWVKTKNGPKSIEFITSASQIPGNIKKVKPLSSDFTRFDEYFNQARKTEIRDVNGQNVIKWKFKFGLGVIGVGIDYTTISRWPDPNTVFFEGIAGDVDPLYGAWEWVDLKKDSTLIVFTVANNISEQASWVLKLGNRLPNVNIISSIFMGILIVEKQVPWVVDQLGLCYSETKNLAQN